MSDTPHVPPHTQSALPSPQLTCAVLHETPLEVQRAGVTDTPRTTSDVVAGPAPLNVHGVITSAGDAPVAAADDGSDDEDEQASLVMLSEPSSLYAPATSVTESSTSGALLRPAQAVSAPVTTQDDLHGDNTPVRNTAMAVSSSAAATVSYSAHEPRRHGHDALVLAEARREVASPVLFSTHTHHALRTRSDTTHRPRHNDQRDTSKVSDNNEEEGEGSGEDYFTSTSRAALLRLRHAACHDDEADRRERRAHRRRLSSDAVRIVATSRDACGTSDTANAMRMRFVLPATQRSRPDKAIDTAGRPSTTQAATATKSEPRPADDTASPSTRNAVGPTVGSANETTNTVTEECNTEVPVAERASTPPPPRKRVKLSLSHPVSQPAVTGSPHDVAPVTCVATQEEDEEADDAPQQQQQQQQPAGSASAPQNTTRKLRLLRVSIKEPPPPSTPTQQANCSASAGASAADSSINVCSPRSVRAAVSAFTEEQQAARRLSAERTTAHATSAEPASPGRKEDTAADNATVVTQTTLSGPGFGSLIQSVQSFASPTSSPSPYYGLNTPVRRMHSATHIPLPTAPLSVDFGSVTHTVEDYYEVTAKISEGTYGEVYRGKDRRTGAQVALKRLKTLRGLDGFPITSLREVIALQHINRQRARLRRQREERKQKSRGEADREAKTTTTPANAEDEDSLEEIVTLCDVLLSKEDTHDIYLVFTYASSSLAGLLSRRFPFTLREIAYIFRKITLGVYKLHAMGIIHRDIKSDNILLTADATVQLADFGLCVFARSGKRAMTPSLINLAYRPPEMLLGSMEYDAKVDVWSIGCLLAQVFLGVPPFYRAAANNNNNADQRGGPRQQAGPQDHRSADTELSQLALICEVLGPITKLPPNTFSESSCRHLAPLRHMQQLYLSGQDYMADVNDMSLDRTQMRTGRSLTQLQPLFEASFLFTRYNGFRRWFLSALENRRARHARARIYNPQADIPPLLVPSQSCLDVMTRIFQLDPRRRPTAAEMLNMPFFQLKPDETIEGMGSAPLNQLVSMTDSIASREAAVRQALREKLSNFTDSHVMPHAPQQ